MDSGLQPERMDHVSFSPQCPHTVCRHGPHEPDTQAKSDTNKIRFCSARHAFKLVYSSGVSEQTMPKSFEVARADALGNILSYDDYAKVKAAILHRARMQWNLLDKKDAPRFQDPTSSGDAAACSRDGGLQP